MPIKKHFLLVVIFSIRFCTAISSGSGLYLHIQTVHRLVNESIIINVEGVKSLLHCAFKCKMRSGESLYYSDLNQTCTCNSDPDTNTYHNKDIEAMTYGGYSQKATVSKENILPYQEDLITKTPRQDCNKHSEAGHMEDGVYPLFIKEKKTTVYVWCSMGSEGFTGPLTIIQQRYSGSVDFYRPWSEYVSGFGSANGEYWLGLEYIAAMTNSSLYGLFINVMSDETNHHLSTFLGFKDFRLIERENYRIIVSEPSMIESTCLSGVDASFVGVGMEFSTFDADNDLNDSTKCAEQLKSAWWFGTSCEVFQINSPVSETSDFMPFVASQACWITNVPIYHTSMALMVES